LQDYLAQAQNRMPGAASLKGANANSPATPAPPRYYDVKNWTMPEQSEEDAAWENPAYNPDREKYGYTQYNANVYGSGLNRTKNYEQGARNFAGYASLAPGTPGYDHFVGASNNLRNAYGITDWRKATPKQLFDAFDAEMRSAQLKNQRPKRKFGIKQLAGFALPALGNFLLPGIGGAIGGTAGSLINGGNIGDIAKNAGLSYLGGKIAAPIGSSIKTAIPGVGGAVASTAAKRAVKRGVKGENPPGGLGKATAKSFGRYAWKNWV
jgi:hypothetical protein